MRLCKHILRPAGKPPTARVSHCGKLPAVRNGLLDGVYALHKHQLLLRSLFAVALDRFKPLKLRRARNHLPDHIRHLSHIF